MNDEVRLVIADDHPVVRKGLRAMLDEDPELTVVGEAGDGEAALALILRLEPHVAVLDVDMPKLDGFGVARELVKRQPSTKVIFLTLHNDEDLFRAALELGARGYLLKDSAMLEIATAVRTVACGRPYFSSDVTARLLQGSATDVRRDDGGVARLTPTERRILRLIADGQSSKDIGASLSIHYRTVENHRTNICRKLGIEGAHALLRFALHHKSRL